MIHGIGTDIVAIARVQAGLDRHGERFARRILSEQEMLGYSTSAQPVHFLAKRFAAKEAAVKALGTGFRDGISLSHVEVSNNEHGRPELNLNGRAAEVAASLGVGEAHLSLSDEKEYAIAFVTLMRRD